MSFRIGKEDITIQALGEDIREFADYTEKQVNELLRATSLQMLTTLADATPVDTGKARSNWLTTVTEIADYEVEAGFEYVGFARGNLDKSRPADIINITNNVTYMQELNAGWSRQAPAMFIEQSVDLVTGEISSIAETIFRKGR